MPELSYTDRMQLLSRALTAQGEGSSYVRDVFDGYFTYQSWNSSDGMDPRTWQRDYSIDAENRVTLGVRKEVTARTVYDPVVMSATFSGGDAAPVGDGYILRTGKLFEAGEWPDKGYAMTADELAAAAASFAPVDIDLEHVPTVLDGKLGQLKSVEVRGSELFGTVAVPEWLDSLLEDGARKVSCTWDKATKRLSGLAIVRTPRITDAALYAAFSTFAGKRHSAADLADLQKIHDIVTGQGAVCAPRPAAYYADEPIADETTPGTGSTKEPKPMTLWDKLQAALTGQEVEAGTPAGAPAAAGFSADEVAAFKEKADAFDALQAQFASVKADADAYRAKVAEDAKKAHVRLFGAEPDDAKTASFGAQSVADVAALAALWNETADAKFGIGKAENGGAKRESAPSATAAYSADASGGQNADAEEARIAKLLATSELGRLAASRNANGK